MDLANIVSIVVLAVVLNLTGKWACQHRPALNDRAVTIGTLSFLMLLALGLLVDRGLSNVISHVIRSGLLAWCVTGLTRLLLPCCTVVYDRAVRGPMSGVRSLTQSTRRAVADRRRGREQRAREEEERREWEKQQPERDRAERLRLRKEREQEIRNQIQYEIHLLYDRHRTKLADRFPEERLSAYFKSHLTNDLSLGVYRERATQLRTILLECAGQASGATEPVYSSPEEIIADFEERLQRMQQLLGDDDTFDTLQVDLYEERDQLLRQFFRRAKSP